MISQRHTLSGGDTNLRCLPLLPANRYIQPSLYTRLSTDLQLRKANDFSARYQFEDAVQAFDQVLVNDPSNYKAKG